MNEYARQRAIGGSKYDLSPQYSVPDRAARDEHPDVRRHQALHAPRQPRAVRDGAQEALPLRPPHLQHRPHHRGRPHRRPRGPHLRRARLHHGHPLSIRTGGLHPSNHDRYVTYCF